MKKMIYQVTCMLLALTQTFVAWFGIFAIVYEIFDTMASVKEGGVVVPEMFIIFPIVFFIIEFILAIFDRLLRKIKNFNWFIDCFLIVVTSLFKGVTQLITFIKYCKTGDEVYGERGCENKFLLPTLYYMGVNVHTGNNFRIETKKQAKKRQENYQKYTEIVNRMKKEEEDRKRTIEINRRNDRLVNVHVVPLAAIDYDKFMLFSSYTSLRSEAKLLGLWVNGVNYFERKVYASSAIGLSLKPGTYNFKIEVELSGYSGIEKDVDGNSTKFHVHKYFELKNIYVDSSHEYHLVFTANLQPQWSQYINSYTGKIVKNVMEDGWSKKYSFDLVSKQSLEKVIDYWMAGEINY